MRSRRLMFIAGALVAAPAAAQDIALVPKFGTQFRYEQSASDQIFGGNDALLLKARPGIALAGDGWSIDAVTDASVAVRRDTGNAAAATRTPMRPDALGLSELRLQYRGLPRTAISVGRQRLGMASASITGDRDGEQTFDAARVQWKGFLGLSADIAYAWNSSSLWAAAEERPLPETVAGENLFAQVNWKTALGTLSGYAYQIDQRHAAASDFHLLNQVYGARLTGNRKLGQDVKLNYTLGYVRQLGSLSNAAGGAPTYWLMGSNLDLSDLSGTSTSYRRFAANGISTMNGDKLSLATSATNGRVTLGATFNDFRPLPETSAIPNRDVRVSLGLIF